MRLMCPTCGKMIDVPESAVGTEFACPVCTIKFPVPSAYAPSVAAPPPGIMPVTDPVLPTSPIDRPPAPPGLAPPVVPPATAAGAAARDGTTHVRGVSLHPQVVEWVPVACLAVAFILTFFAWVGIYPGGYRAYSQSAWEALVGGFSTDYFSEKVLKLEAPLKAAVKSNWLFLLPYLAGLIAALALAALDRGLKNPSLSTLPGPLLWVLKVWPVRHAILAGLAGVLFLLVAAQSFAGFGLETAARQIAAEKFKGESDKAESTADKQTASVNIGREYGQYGVQGTTPLTAVILLHAVALFGLAGRWWLDRRGDKPPPRVELRW